MKKKIGYIVYFQGTPEKEVYVKSANPEMAYKEAEKLLRKTMVLNCDKVETSDE